MNLDKSSLSLVELNEMIKDYLRLRFDAPFWIHAEISELHENNNGHAYFELIEKDLVSNRIIAKNRATCWGNTFRLLKPYFENATGERLRDGLRVLVACTVEYHELYGISLNIRDIEPSFTIGELALQRMKIIRQLQEDGVFDMNKNLVLSPIPQRIAIVSSATAAGYEDFMNQLKNNVNGLAFYTKLFPAVMQGEQCPSSIIAALDKIFTHQDKFDAVAIIRGGGASSELSCFDNYELAFNCTQFPLPIITGIGHERDESILDMVAHTRCKTPTALAEFLISSLKNELENLFYLQQMIVTTSKDQILEANIHLQNLRLKIPIIVNKIVLQQKSLLSNIGKELKNKEEKLIGKEQSKLEKLKDQLCLQKKLQINKRQHRLDFLEQEVKFSSPEIFFKRGFSRTYLNGEIVKSIASIKKGDHISTLVGDGKIESIVE